MSNIITGQVQLRGSVSPQRKVNIAIPAYQNVYCGELVRSLFLTIPALQKIGFQTSLSDIDYSDIVVSRNYLISNFYFNKPDCSHMLFLDNDMGFEPSLIVDMLQLEKDIVGAICPRRNIDLVKLHSTEEPDFQKAKAAALNFISDGAKTHEMSGKFMKVSRCGTGIFLIARSAVNTLIEKCPSIVDYKAFKRMPFGSKFSQFIKPFEKIQTDEIELSEDLSFCHRWTQECGGELWASIDHPIQHVGRFVFEGRYSDLL